LLLTNIVLCFCLICVRLVYPMLPVSLDCPFLILRFFSNVYFSEGCIFISTIQSLFTNFFYHYKDLVYRFFMRIYDKKE
jgi:hypothetical protein